MRKSIIPLLLLLSAHCCVYAQPCTIPADIWPDDSVIVCTGTTFQLDAAVVPGATYSWSVAGEGGSSVNLGVNGTYWVQINDGVCTVTDTVLVLFNSFLLAPIVYDTKLCKNQPALPLPVSGENLQW